MTKDEALKLALEALENTTPTGFNMERDKQFFVAITAIKEVLAQPEQHQDWCASLTQMLASMPPKPAPCNCKPAQPEQEPVAWLHTKIEGVAVPHRPADLDKHPDRWEALYKTPPPCPTCEALARTVMLDQTSHDTTPPQQEPVIDKSAAVRIATALGWEPKRTWVGLTNEEIDAILKRGDVAEHDAWNGRWYVLPYSFSQAIEAKLKEKNT